LKGTMASIFDSAASILLCAEDNKSILGFDDEEVENARGYGHSWVLRERSDFYGGFLMDFPLQSDECVGLLVERESEHMPRGDYVGRILSGALDPSVRRDAIDWIWKVCSHYSFGPLTLYLSVNYLDRFLSAYELPVGEAKHVFEARTIQRMELLVLSTLKWRMQAVTPFSFIDYFLHEFNGGNAPSKMSVSHSVELVLSTLGGTDFLSFKPSEKAAAVALTVLGECQSAEVEKVVASCEHLDKERVLRCCELIQDMVMMGVNLPKTGSPAVLYVPQSPIGVLDAAWLSYSSEDSSVGSQETSYESSPTSKRRKISR
ncbi:Cyclin-D3-1, partial [Ananas comosus]